jgi:hypothetical protein
MVLFQPHLQLWLLWLTSPHLAVVTVRTYKAACTTFHSPLPDPFRAPSVLQPLPPTQTWPTSRWEMPPPWQSRQNPSTTSSGARASRSKRYVCSLLFYYD